MAGLLDAVRAWLRSQHHIHVPDDWLEACADWVEEERGRKLSPGELRQAVYEQWLLSDLRGLSHPCLPAGVATEIKFTLDGGYSLQVDSVRDVSQPAYSQLKKMQGRENENAAVNASTQFTQQPWEVKSNRMLMLKLTDGVQDVQGMEYRTIRHINLNLPPGTKITVIGSVLCRLGTLMLTDENVRVLGGEVESMAQENTVRNVLARTLELDIENLPSNLRPKTGKNLDFLSTQATQSQPQPSTNPQRSNSSNQRPPPVNVNQRQNPPNQQPKTSHVASSAGMSLDDGFDDDDDVFSGIDADHLATHWEDDDALDFAMSQINVPHHDHTSKVPSTVTSRPPPVQASTSRVTSQPFQPIKNASISMTSRNASNPSQAPPRIGETASNRSIDTSYPSDMSFGSEYDEYCPQKNAPLSDMDCDFPEDQDLCEMDDINTRHIKPVLKRAQNSSGDSSMHIATNIAITKPMTSFGDAPIQKPESANFSSQIETGPRTAVVHASRSELTDTPHYNSKSDSGAVASGSNLSNFNVLDGFLLDDDFEEVLETKSPKRLRLNDERPLPEKINELYESRDQLQRTDRPLSLDSEPYIYLRQVVAMLPVKCKTSVRVKAYVSTVIRRLDHNRGKFWSLGVKLNDGTASLDVAIDDQVIRTMMGASAEETVQLRKDSAKDPDVKNTLHQMIGDFQRKLIDLSTIFELDLSPEMPEPCLVKLVEFTRVHAQLLYERLRQNFQ